MELSWATPLYILAVYGLFRFTLRPKDVKSDDRNSATYLHWSPLESVSVTLGVYFIGQLLGGLAVYMPLLAAGWSDDKITNWLSSNAVGQFILIAVIEALTIGLLVIFLKRRQASLKSVGLFGKPELQDVGKAIGAYLIYFVLYLVLVAVLKSLIPSLDVEQRQDIGFENVVSWQLPLVFTSLVILPPLTEEILMRGFMYTGLRAKTPKFVAVGLTSSLFAIAHLQAGNAAPLLWIAAIDTFVLSLVLIYLKDKTGRLWAPIFLHGIKNLVAFVALFIFAR